MERDSFKFKYLKCNEFLNINKDKNNNDNNKKLNIDELLSQNGFLTESNQHLREELDMMKITHKKYKQILTSGGGENNNNENEKEGKTTKTNTTVQRINNLAEANVLNKAKIRTLLDEIQGVLVEKSNEHSAFSLLGELKLVTETLIESLNDKLTANQHQRKVNKMLASRIHDLEKQQQDREVNQNTRKSTITNKKKDTDTEDVDGLDEPEATTPTNSNSNNDASNSLFFNALQLQHPLIPTNTNKYSTT